MTTGWYYLHDNGMLIYKRDLDGTVADLRESDLVRMFWRFDSEERITAWTIVVEALALGAKRKRVDELVALWQCTDADASVYGEHVGIAFDMDGDHWCAKPLWFTNLQDHDAGFGKTRLEAAADLCKRLGYVAQKTWGASFADLLKPKAA